MVAVMMVLLVLPLSLHTQEADPMPIINVLDCGNGTGARKTSSSGQAQRYGRGSLVSS